MSGRVFWEKQFLLKISCYFINFGFWSNTFRPFGRVLSVGQLKLCSASQKKFLRAKFFEKYVGFKYFLLQTVSSKMFVFFRNFSAFRAFFCRPFWKKFSPSLSKLYFTCPEEQLRKFFWKICDFQIISELWIENFRLFDEIFRHCFQKLHFRCRDEHFEEKSFLKIFHIFHRFGTLSEILLAIWQKLLDKLVKTAFYMPKGFFWVKVCKKAEFFSSFWDFERKFCGPLPKNFRQGCQNCILRVHRDILRKTVFLKSY